MTAVSLKFCTVNIETVLEICVLVLKMFIFERRLKHSWVVGSILLNKA